MKHLLPIGVSLLVISGIYLFVGKFHVEVQENTAVAQTSLPENVKKFTDGEVNCYVLQNEGGFRDVSVAYGGISCVK